MLKPWYRSFYVSFSIIFFFQWCPPIYWRMTLNLSKRFAQPSQHSSVTMQCGSVVIPLTIHPGTLRNSTSIATPRDLPWLSFAFVNTCLAALLNRAGEVCIIIKYVRYFWSSRWKKYFFSLRQHGCLVLPKFSCFHCQIWLGSLRKIKLRRHLS